MKAHKITYYAIYDFNAPIKKRKMTRVLDEQNTIENSVLML